MNKKALCYLITLLIIYIVATYYSFNASSIAFAIALQFVTNFVSIGIGAVLMFMYIFIFKLPH